MFWQGRRGDPRKPPEKTHRGGALGVDLGSARPPRSHKILVEKTAKEQDIGLEKYSLRDKEK